jgi:zinc protease
MTLARLLSRAALPLALALTSIAPARAQDPALLDPSTLATPPLRRVQAPKPERLVMPNGIVVFLLEDHSLPVVRGSAYFRSSPLWVPAEKTGLADVTGDVVRTGGSAAHSGDWLDDRLAAIGASISSGIQPDQAYAGFRCLRENVAEVVGLFAEIQRTPAFPEDKIELARVGLRQSIASRNDEMINLLVRTATEAVYGKDNPYARKPEYATVEAITREDCQKLHAQAFRPERMVLAVYGDFKPAEMKKLLAATFGDWKRGAAVAVPPPPVPPMAPSRLVFAPKDDVTSTGVIISHLGFRADDPDYAAMNVYGMALGGGFQSRLVNKIRTERGLAYASGAMAGADFIRPGVFLAYTLTRNDSALTALDLLRGETRKTVEAPFTPEELKAAKESESNSLVFSFAEPSAILFRTAFYEMAGYPLDFLDRYQKALEGVDAAGVLAAAQRKIQPDRFVAVLVGKEKEFERPLESMGLPVERVDIAIPPPPSKLAVGEASPEALARADGAGQGRRARRRHRRVADDQERGHRERRDHAHGRAEHVHDRHHAVAAARPHPGRAPAAHGRDQAGLRRDDRLDGGDGTDAGAAQGRDRAPGGVRALVLPAVRPARCLPGADAAGAEGRGRRELRRGGGEERGHQGLDALLRARRPARPDGVHGRGDGRGAGPHAGDLRGLEGRRRRAVAAQLADAGRRQARHGEHADEGDAEPDAGRRAVREAGAVSRPSPGTVGTRGT